LHWAIAKTLAITFLFAFNSYADYCTTTPQTSQPSSFELAQVKDKDFPDLDSKIIRHINIRRYNVFDPDNPKENNAIFRWLNGLHIISTEQTIAEDLLFVKGTAYRDVLLSESERILRQRKYIFDASIKPIAVCNKYVDIEVATRDTWTITPGFSVSRSGGETSTKVSLTESNLFGTGKLLSFSKANTNERTEYTLRYKDPNIAGTRRTTAVELSENSDGQRQLLTFSLPFYSLDSKKSYGFSYQNEQRLDPIYVQEDKIYEIKHKLRHYDLYFGKSQGYQNNKTKRWRYGLSYQIDRLSHSFTDDRQQTERRLIYPWVEYSSLANNFTKIQNYRSIKRTEDLNLGRSLHIKLGYSPHSLADDDSRFIFSFGSKNAFKHENQLVTASANIQGYWNKSAAKGQGILTKLNAGYYNFINEDWVFYTGVKVNHLINPLVEQQLFLGGETGIRGYPVRFSEGTKNIVLSFEQRYYSDSYWLQLVRVGAAAYLDVGRSWQPQQASSPRNNGWYSSIGIGLRLTPSRVDANHIIHIDLATPLNERDSLKKTQFLVKVKQSF